MEMIQFAAIKYDDLGVQIVMRPGRHSHIIRDIYRKYGRATKGSDEQGFWTTEQRFVDRKEARRIAVASGQLKGKSINENSLFSEDLW